MAQWYFAARSTIERIVRNNKNGTFLSVSSFESKHDEVSGSNSDSKAVNAKVPTRPYFILHTPLHSRA